MYSLLELGDMPATDAEIDAYASLTEEQQQPLHLSLTTGFRAMRALMQGRFADSERLAQQALSIGQRLQTETAAGIFGQQMFALRREQGRLKELEPVVRYFVQQHTISGTWRPGLALIYSELGRAEKHERNSNTWHGTTSPTFLSMPCGWRASPTWLTYAPFWEIGLALPPCISSCCRMLVTLSLLAMPWPATVPSPAIWGH